MSHVSLSSSGTRGAGELSTSDALRLVRILAQAGVYQVNLGGGEPFLRSDTFDLIQAGVEAGMLMCASAEFQRLGKWLAERPEVHTGDSFFFLQEGGDHGGGGSALDRCGAARLTLGVDPRGNAFPCPFLAGPAWRMGHLLLDPFPQVWGALPWVRDVPGEVCLACLDRRCSRDCPARNIDGERIYGLEAAVG